MARKSVGDERQTDFFGAPPPSPEPPKRSVRKTQKPPPEIAVEPAQIQPQSLIGKVIEQESLDSQLSRLTSADFRELASVISDEVLADLTLAFARELQRRSAKSRRQERNGRKSGLTRAAEQLIADMSHSDTGDDFDW